MGYQSGTHGRGHPAGRGSHRGVLLSFSSSRWSEVGWPRFVEGAVSEHGEQDVGSASGQSDDGLVVAFAFGSFLVVVRAGSGIAFDRSESGEEQHTLEDFVAAP